METLREKQSRHVVYTGLLIAYAKTLGYELTWGETLRSEEEAEEDAKQGKGISNSLHRIGLAVDLNLFKDGKWLKKGLDHKPLGLYWESLAPDCRWGGRWGDGNHYSIEHEGVK
jgi:hypothetical protein